VGKAAVNLDVRVDSAGRRALLGAPNARSERPFARAWFAPPAAVDARGDTASRADSATALRLLPSPPRAKRQLGPLQPPTRGVVSRRVAMPAVRGGGARTFDIALSAGDPSGVGPEVIRSALRRLPRGARVRVFGDASLAARLGGGTSFVEVTRLAAADRRPGRPTRAGGLAQLAYLEAAVREVEAGRAVALVTAPVSKEGITRATGRAFSGHTEWLAARAGRGPDDVAMVFTGGGITVALATTHIPLAKVARTLRPARILRVTQLLHAWLRGFDRRRRRARILVCALNPHAGEGGLVGDEEARIVAPAVRAARRLLGSGIVGPVPADAAFRIALDRPATGVVALYHDQATLPVKLVAFGRSANITLGLPYLRTSVDHGVAYDRAGRGTAQAGGLVAAIEIAFRRGERARRDSL